MATVFFGPNGTQLTDNGFRLDGEAFPAGWLALVDDTALARYGISKQEVPDPDPVPQLPTEATPRQLRLAMLQTGLYDQVLALVPTLSAEARIEFEYATAYRREHPMWNTAAAALGKTPADVDALFALAVTL